MTRAPWSSAPDTRRAMARRRGERRRGAAALCQALAVALAREQGEGLRARFLEAARRVLPAAASLTIRDWLVGESPALPAADRRLLSVNVPTSDPRHVAALDAIPAEAREFDEWDLQMLSTAGRLAGGAAGDRSASQDAARPVRCARCQDGPTAPRR